MRARVDSMRQILDMRCPDVKLPISYTTIDWGSSKRGQGKRVGGGLIVGSMSCALGKRTYSGIDLSQYKEDFDEADWIVLKDYYRRAKYYTARINELCHWEALYYAVSNVSTPERRKLQQTMERNEGEKNSNSKRH